MAATAPQRADFDAHCDYAELERRANAALYEARRLELPAEAQARYLEATLLLGCAIRAAVALGDKTTEQRLSRLLIQTRLSRLPA